MAGDNPGNDVRLYNHLAELVTVLKQIETHLEKIEEHLATIAAS